MAPRKKVLTPPNGYILNCKPSRDTETDWTMADAMAGGSMAAGPTLPPSKDLREPSWWKIRDQDGTGACVGFAAADSVLRWHYVKAQKIPANALTSPRFIWMADKETDDYTTYPTTFLETDGTMVKQALQVARKFGCVLEKDLPMTGPLSFLSLGAFYSRAAQLRIASYYNLIPGQAPDLKIWKAWIAFQGPILTRLEVDRTWDNASATQGHLRTYLPNTARGGHAVALVGYTADYFIVRNSWGTVWGDQGFGYAHNDYAKKAFTEAYGAIL